MALELDFNSVFEVVVKPLIEQVFNGVDEPFREKVALKTRNLLSVKTNCKASYQKKEDELKQMFYGKKYSAQKNDSSEEFRFDIHKVAAILCYTLIRNKVFTFDVDKAYDYISANPKNCQTTSWIVNNVLVNYKLAFHASINMIYQKSLFDSNKNTNSEMIRLLTDEKSLFLYEKREGHESFANSIIYDFAKRDIRNRSFDCLMYSAMLFQIEEYNKLYFSTK